MERSSNHLTANTVMTHCLLHKDKSPAPGPGIFVQVLENKIKIACACLGDRNNTGEKRCYFDIKKCKQEGFNDTKVISKDEFMQSRKSPNDCDTPQR